MHNLTILMFKEEQPTVFFKTICVIIFFFIPKSQLIDFPLNTLKSCPKNVNHFASSNQVLLAQSSKQFFFNYLTTVLHYLRLVITTKMK